MISVTVDASGAIARINGLAQSSRTDLLAVLGREMRNQVVGHLRGLETSRPNKRGWKREHFWLQMARSVQAPQVDSGAGTVTTTISDPRFRQKVEGGTIRPKNKRALTIPVTEEAYGRTAATVEKELGIKLFVMPSSDYGTGLLAGIINKGRKKGDKGKIKIFFVLRGSVTQAPDPDALPSGQSLLDAMAARAESWISNNGGGSSLS